MQLRLLRAAVVFFLIAESYTATAEDWPQWQGPRRDNTSSETGLLKEWPEGGPPRAWLFEDCGIGYSGPAIADGKLFTMGERGGVTQLIALDAVTGKELWAAKLGGTNDGDYLGRWGAGPRGTPTVDGDRVYALADLGELACVSVSDGVVQWKVSLVEDLGGVVPKWGYSESPLVDGDLVLCTPGVAPAKKAEEESAPSAEAADTQGGTGAIVALDKRTGEVKWQTSALEDRAHYSSIVSAELNGQPQFVQLLTNHLVGISKADGRLLWEAPWPDPTAAIPTPIVRGNRVYATTGYGVGSMLVEIGPGNEVTEVYRNKVMKNKHGGIVLLEGHVYGHSERAGWVCQDFETGELVWRDRKSLGMGALGFADGMLYLVDQDNGEVALVRPSTEGWEERGRFTLDPQSELRKPAGRIWTHPVIAGGKLYLRDQDLLYCYDVSDGSSTTARR